MMRSSEDVLHCRCTRVLVECCNTEERKRDYIRIFFSGGQWFVLRFQSIFSLPGILDMYIILLLKYGFYVGYIYIPMFCIKLLNILHKKTIFKFPYLLKNETEIS